MAAPAGPHVGEMKAATVGEMGHAVKIGIWAGYQEIRPKVSVLFLILLIVFVFYFNFHIPISNSNMSFKPYSKCNIQNIDMNAKYIYFYKLIYL